MNQSILLERLYSDIRSIILTRQNPITGLLPASTSINMHGDYTDAWVRDNVYSIMAVWALGLACKRAGLTDRRDELEQATIKLMRGLLQAMMRQAGKVEKFKHSQNRLDALHAKYDTNTGLEVVADDAWGHLQIDATSIFLLMLAEMSASGLRIVTTLSEVDFVQNLVYYIATAFRTPDYGIWERGNKINDGKTEVNSSSVGMAKAALQALDNFNLFGPNATQQAIIHTNPDSVSLARATLEALLPRESLSKEVDSALLSIIGYPAFAVGDPALVKKTRNKILHELEGNYGCKRFLWDGHQTALEDMSRIHYEVSELANFEHVESEWPLFFTYLYITALFEDDAETAQKYRQKIENIMVDRDGQQLIPELYYVDTANIAEEKRHPHSQPRIPNDNLPLVWAQSLYYTGLMLDEGLLTQEDLDPLKIRSRSSLYGTSEVALVVLAETPEVKQTLSNHGVISETLEEISPLGVVSAKHLVEAYSLVGANQALQLSGRPKRRLRGLTTSQTYAINNQRYLCLSWLQSEYGDYRRYDPDLVVEKVLREIQHVRKDWYHREVGVFTILVDSETCNMANSDILFSRLRSLQLREQHEQVGYASASLAMRASRCNQIAVPGLELLPIQARRIDPAYDLDNLRKLLRDQPVAGLLQALSDPADESALCGQVADYFTGKDYATEIGEAGANMRDLLKSVYKQAQRNQQWMLARLCFSLLNHAHVGLADSLTALQSRHVTVLIHPSSGVELPSDPLQSDLEAAGLLTSLSKSPIEKTLIQEIIVTLGSLLRTEPHLFQGLRTIQLHNLVLVATQVTADDSGDFNASVGVLSKVSPFKLYSRIRAILSQQHELFADGVQHRFQEEINYRSSGKRRFLSRDWFVWRTERGLLTGFDDEFVAAVWESLGNAAIFVIGDKESSVSRLDCEAIRRTMTPGEESFAKLIDQWLQPLHPAYYKSTIIEALYAFTVYVKANPDAYFVKPVNFGAIAELAAELYVKQETPQPPSDRHLDVLMQLSPSKVHDYLQLALELQYRTQTDDQERSESGPKAGDPENDLEHQVPPIGPEVTELPAEQPGSTPLAKNETERGLESAEPLNLDEAHQTGSGMQKRTKRTTKHRS